MTVADLVPLVPALSSSQIKAIAGTTLKKLFPDLHSFLQPDSLARLFEFGDLNKIGFSYGIEVLPRQEEAHTDFKENIIILSPGTYDALLKGMHRARFTLAHEIGHAVLHTCSIKTACLLSASRKSSGTMPNSADIPKFRRGKFPAYMDPEWQANKFASLFLMPEDLLNWLANKGLLTAQTLASYANVSEEAATYRIIEYKKSR